MSSENLPEVREFLDRACNRIFDKAAREKVRAELLDHLEEAIQRGESPEVAISALGEPWALGSSFSRVHRPFFLTAPFVATACVGLMVLGILTLSYRNRLWLEALSSNVSASMKTHFDRFAQDHRILDQEPVFAFPGKSKDAGPYLNPRIVWEVSKYGRTATTVAFLNRPAEITLPSEASDQLKKLGFGWTERAATSTLTKGSISTG